MRRFPILGLGLLLALATACASTLGYEDLDARLRAVGRSVPGRSQVFPIYAQTRMEAWTLLADAANEPRSQLSLDLARQISTGRTRRVSFVVGGPYADLNGRIVRNALDYHQEPLPGLTLVLVSPETPGPELGALARERRVRLLHSPLE